jgi:hypothetical protein
MEEKKKISSTRSPMKDIDFNVVTSTPVMRSEIGIQLVRKHFVKNLPKDISVLALKFENFNIEEQSPEVKPFIFTKDNKSTTPNHNFHTPKTISTDTIEKFNLLFSDSPKLKRKRIRMWEPRLMSRWRLSNLRR